MAVVYNGKIEQFEGYSQARKQLAWVDQCRQNAG
jgi:hypothetical protein